jgi:hypothetical protein
MALDFPSSPTVGQIYPTPAPGVISYRWDGEKWTTVGTMQGMPNRFWFSATAGQTTFSGMDGAGLTLSYVANAVEVAVNGMWLPYTEYTATNGTSIVLASPSNLGDIVYVYSQTTFQIADAVSFTKAQSLSAGQQAQARQNVYAAPFDALAYSGMQINGGMEISQENGSSAISLPSGANKYIVDGWHVGVAGPAASVAQVTNVYPPGYTSSIYIYTTTAKPSLAAADWVAFAQSIEGNRIARLAWGTASAQPIAIAFWVFSNRTGMFSGAVGNSAADRSYPFTFNINSTTVWEYKTVTIPGCPDGVWNKDNTSGLSLAIAMACGTTYAGPANAWASTNYVAATGTTNGCANVGDYIYLTGVVILPGLELPSASRAPLIQRPYGQELLTCKRYWELLPTYSVAYALTGTGTVALQFPFAVEKRVAPSMAYVAGGTYTNCVINGGRATTKIFAPILNISTTSFYVFDTSATVDARL